MALQPYLSILVIHDRAAKLTSAPVKREKAGVGKQQQIIYYKSDSRNSIPMKV
jgi:hypothetical protein